MPETQQKEQNARIIPMTVNDMILMQIQEQGKRMDRLEKNLDTTRQELSQRMDRLERRQDRLEEKLETMRQELNARMDKQDEKIEKLADKIDALGNKIDSAMNHGQIITVSAVGIAVSVMYSVFFK